MALEVLDSLALIAYFEDTPRSQPVEPLPVKVEAGAHKLLLCAVNRDEMCYGTMRQLFEEAAEQTAKERASLTIEIAGVDEKN